MIVHLFLQNKTTAVLLKDISEALEQMTNYSERYKWGSMSSRILMQLCEDSITFNNFRSWYFIQTTSKIKQNKMTLQAKHISCGE